MIIEIDQSGRVENTNKPTVLAFSNSSTRSILILAKDKRLIQEYFRENHRPRMYVYETFAALVFLLVCKHVKNNHVIIDKEYFGNEGILKSLIIEIFSLQKLKISKYDVSFDQIGKKSNAHRIAIRAYRTNKADRQISADDVLKIIRSRNQKTGSKMNT